MQQCAASHNDTSSKVHCHWLYQRIQTGTASCCKEIGTLRHHLPLDMYINPQHGKVTTLTGTHKD